jgi:hypothetical protein
MACLVRGLTLSGTSWSRLDKFDPMVISYVWLGDGVNPFFLCFEEPGPTYRTIRVS